MADVRTAPSETMISVKLTAAMRRRIKRYKHRFELDTDSEVVRLAVQRLLDEAGIPDDAETPAGQLAS